MDIVTKLRSTRATMLGTDDEQHYADCHDAAREIEWLRNALEQCKYWAESMRTWDGKDWHYHSPYAKRIHTLASETLAN